jgi:pimeloyl-ACP methyl ester carboxylesterase
MYEKITLEEGMAPATPARRSGHWKGAGLAFLALCFFATEQFSSPRTGMNPHHHKCSSSPSHLKYAGEKISWEPCGDVSGRPVECSNITVPMDQFDATKSGDKTFSIPLIRMRGANATQNLLLNPGGPGGSGTEFVFRRGKQLADIVGEGFHLLSFDPRGINASLPQASCFPNREARKLTDGIRDTGLEHDSAEAYAWGMNLAQACRGTMDEHGGYINTPQTAADMNSILEAVGQEDLIYWGFRCVLTMSSEAKLHC